MKQNKKIAVVCGGTSNEREVSFNSGRNVYAALQRLGYTSSIIELGHDTLSFILSLEKEKPDAVFNALHGSIGEDGNIQGLLNMLGIPYTHSGVLASALAMDKCKAKTMFEKAGIPVPCHELSSVEKIRENGDILPRPYVIKPVCDGSSFGVTIIRDWDNVGTLLKDWCYGETVMVEEYIPGREFTAAVIGGEYIGMLEVITDRDFYNYDAKYSEGGSEHVVPCDLSEEVLEKIKEYTLKAHECLGCRGVTRSDFRYDHKSRRLVILELNTQPGMTSTSLVPDIGRNIGKSYDEIIKGLVEQAICDF